LNVAGGINMFDNADLQVPDQANYPNADMAVRIKQKARRAGTAMRFTNSKSSVTKLKQIQPDFSLQKNAADFNSHRNVHRSLSSPGKASIGQSDTKGTPQGKSGTMDQFKMAYNG
jgi:hypothetical protein